MREKRERFFWGRKRRFLETVSESGRLWCYGFVFICVYARTLTFGGVVRATTIGGSVIVLNYAVALHWNRGIVFEPWSFGFCFQHFFILLFLGLRYSFYICIEIPNGALECAKNASHCYCHEIIGSSKLVFCSHPCIWNPFLISIFSLIACCGWHFVFFGLFNEWNSIRELMGMYGKIRRMEDARKVFDDMRERNVVSWSTMIFLGIPATHSKNGVEELQLFSQDLPTCKSYGKVGHEKTLSLITSTHSTTKPILYSFIYFFLSLTISPT